MARSTSIAAGCAAAAAVLLVTVAPPASGASAEVAIERTGQDTATVTFDLAGMPSSAVLVVERRLGPKSPFVEVERTTQDDGVLSIDLPDTRRTVVRATVLGSRGSVLLRSEATL